MSDSEPTFDQRCERLKITPDLRKHIAADSPLKGKMAVARSMLPAEPKVLLAMMYLLLGDPDPQVVEAAQKGLQGIPSQLLLGMLDKQTHPKIIEFLAYRRPPEPRLFEKLALLPQINDKTLFYLAETGEGRLPEIIGSNQERLLVTPRTVFFLRRNPNTPPALLDRITSFLRLHGITLPDLEEEEAAPEATEAPPAATEAAPEAEVAPEPEAAAAPEAPPEPLPVAGEAASAPLLAAMAPIPAALPPDFLQGEVYIPALPMQAPPVISGLTNPLAGLMADWGIQLHPGFLAPPPPSSAVAPAPGAAVDPALPAAAGGSAAAEIKVAASAMQLGGGAAEGADSVDLTGRSSVQGSDFSFDLSEEDDDFDSDFTDDRKEDMDDEKKLNLRQQLEKMTVGEKIKLSYRANKGVREVLVRDSNKIVACAVVNSGRITDSEVQTIATNRSTHEEVIRALTSNREFMRKYPVKVALAGNPKTPIPTAINLLNSLHVKDLQMLSKNRNISSAVFTQAGKLYKRRKSGQG